MTDNVRVRIAPSPTGPIHIGNVRTALFNWLYARHNKGKFILRFEDTDQARSKSEFEDIIMKELRWLGMQWDEGPDTDGSYGPYRQTEKLEIYQKHAEQLLEEKKAYLCYCSPEEIEKERSDSAKKGEAFRYSGKCRNLNEEEKKDKIGSGIKPSVRFKVPSGKDIVIDDLVRGKVEFSSDMLGDFVIIRPDGMPIYNYAVVIDDYDMKITHVIRAEEHISNTPRQVLLYEALGFEIPRFAHASMVLGPDRTKLSKRHGAAFVGQYREDGYLPEALVNFLALLGWSPEGEEEIMPVDELVQKFTLDRIAKNPGIFDIQKLNWMNGHYIRKSSDERILDLALPHLKKAGYLDEEFYTDNREWLMQVIAVVKDNLEYVGQIKEHAKLFFQEKVEMEDKKAEDVLKEETVPLVLRTLHKKIEGASDSIRQDEVKGLLKEVNKELKLGGKKVFMPIRVALTGQTHGPELYQVIPLLGKEKVQQRLLEALK